MSARLFGAALYAAAAAAAAAAAVLGLRIDPSTTGVAIDAAANAALTGAAVGCVIGFLVVTAWPRRLDVAILTGLLSAVVALAAFAVVALVAAPIVTAVAGGSPAATVSDSLETLARGAPAAATVALVGFALAGVVLRVLAGVGRLLARRGRSTG